MTFLSDTQIVKANSTRPDYHCGKVSHHMNDKDGLESGETMTKRATAASNMNLQLLCSPIIPASDESAAILIHRNESQSYRIHHNVFLSLLPT